MLGTLTQQLLQRIIIIKINKKLQELRMIIYLYRQMRFVSIILKTKMYVLKLFENIIL